MIHIDTSQVAPVLADAIFGGPVPPDLEDMIRKMDIMFPCRIAVAQGWVRKGPTGVRALALHPGMTYLMLPPKPITWRKPTPVMGESYLCANASKWLTRLRQGIISLREMELKNTTAMPSRENEQQALLVAMAQVRRNSSDWQAAVNVWMQLVMRLHHHHLNMVRRRLVEFMAALTSPFPNSVPLGYPFQCGMQRIYATYDYAGLQPVFIDVIDDLRPFVMQWETASSSSDAMVNRAMELMREHYTEAISLRDVADHLNVSSAHLARTFKQRSKQTVGQWIDGLRIGYAKRRIIDSNDTLYAIAMDSGFNSVERFHRVFKRQVGMTPNNYRLQSRKITRQ